MKILSSNYCFFVLFYGNPGNPQITNLPKWIGENDKTIKYCRLIALFENTFLSLLQSLAFIGLNKYKLVF